MNQMQNAECRMQIAGTERVWLSYSITKRFRASSIIQAGGGWASTAPCLLGLAIALCGRLIAGELPRTTEFDYEAPVPGSYELPVVKPAADGEVMDLKGRSLRLQEVTRGRVTVMSFIYTRCAATRACPYATGVLRQLYQLSSEDKALAKAMRLVSMSFDPAVDTPDRMAAYAGLADRGSSAAEWRFLTTRSPAQLRPILEAFGQTVDKKQNPFDPTGPLNHTLRVFLIDADGNIRNIYSSDTLDPRLVLADVRTLLMQSKASSKP
jgi:cytochrome oxidase Cu insertion factor (SCO1/SenC/PrrC family)